jgi:hypothetical protein
MKSIKLAVIAALKKIRVIFKEEYNKQVIKCHTKYTNMKTLKANFIFISGLAYLALVLLTLTILV